MKSREFMAALDQIEYEKGIPKNEIMELIENAVRKALEKHYYLASRYRVALDRETGKISAWGIKKVCKEVENPKEEISLKEAKRIKPEVEIQEEIEIPIDINEIARIASETTQKVISQRIREHEKSIIYKKYKSLIGEVITGRVFRFIGRKAIIDLNDTEAILPADAQIPKQFLRLNSHIRALVQDVSGNEKKFNIILSRTSPELVKKLLREEVPEVASGEVEILKVVREPGLRSKILVSTKNKKVDPVGTCVGMRGARIKTIINELGGEKMDVINANLPLKNLIAASLAPVKLAPQNVEIVDEEKKIARVFVTPSQRPQVIGVDGKNIALAGQLLGWKIEVENLQEKK
ncbi:MAG: transcription termination factor NusA [Elusimicrobia bacterium]|nr:transcription termination factor NusA [Elusimicrobiota bacterium]